MVKISAALSAEGVIRYHKEEYASNYAAYYAQGMDGRATGVWFGKEAVAFGLAPGTPVAEEHFARLANGQDPHSGLQLIGWRPPAAAKAAEPAEPAWLTDQAAWREHVYAMFCEAEQSGRPSRWNGREGEPWTKDDEAADQEFRAWRRQLAGEEPLSVSDKPELAKAADKSKQPVQHRAAWDLTFSAPKTISLTALVGGDDRIVKAHDAAVQESLTYAERAIQVKMGGLNAPQTTGRMLAALFQHDTARPVDGYAAPQLHTHAVIFNMSMDSAGQHRALNPRELFYIQATCEAVYQNQLAVRLKALGYELEYGKHLAIEVKGYTKEYRQAESLRTAQIEKEKERLGLYGPQANQNIQLASRAKKLDLQPEEVRALHLAHANEYGNQPEQVTTAARARKSVTYSERYRAEVAEKAIEFAKNRLSERTTVMEWHEIDKDALRFGRGVITLPDVKEAFQRAEERGEFERVAHWRNYAPGHRCTTPELVVKERQILEWMASGRQKVGAIAGGITRDGFRAEFRDHLNDAQKHLVWNLIHSEDRMVGVQGIAGSGKCLGRGTPVLLHCGCVKAVEDIHEGDLLMGPDSQPRRVLSLACGWEEMYDVIPKRGEAYRVNRSHILSLKMSPCPGKKRVGGGRSWKWRGGEIVNLSIDEYFAATNQFRHQAKGWKAGVEFPPKALGLEPYFLGVWLGDGSSRDQAVYNPEPEVKQYLGQYAQRLGAVLTGLNVGEGKCPGYLISNGRPRGEMGVKNSRGASWIKDALRQLGLLNNKHIPHEYKCGSRQQRLGLLAGLLDTDGHLQNGCYEIASVFERLGADIVFLARSLGFHASTRPVEKTCVNNGVTGTYTRINISGNLDEIPCLVERKKGQPRRQKKDHLRSGMTIRSAGLGEYFGFELDGDGLFLLGDFTVTHNTRALATVRDFAERYGYEVRGVAATSGAVNQLREVGIQADTLAAHSLRSAEKQRGPRAYLLDEASLTDVHQMSDFLGRLKRADRVIVIGDTRQHGSVGAGRMFAELQEAGMETFHLKKIVRQRDPAYREVVQHLSVGQIAEALEKLDQDARIHEFADERVRHRAIAAWYLRDPAHTLVVSPDNRSRLAISEVIRAARQEVRQLSGESYRARALDPRSGMTKEDLRFAGSYRVGDVVLYARNAKAGIRKGDRASVMSVAHDSNVITVLRESDGKAISYNPRRTGSSATVYEPAYREFAVGDRVQFTRAMKREKIANRALGTIERIDTAGNVAIRLDTGQRWAGNLERMPHLDWGYAVTSHAAQGSTAERVLVNLDTDAPGTSRMLTQQLIYVAASRGRAEVQLFTNSHDDLAESLLRSEQKASALAPAEITRYQGVTR